MSELEELACQRILHPAMAWIPSAAELVELDRINERNLKIRQARSNVSHGRYIPPRPPINCLAHVRLEYQWCFAETNRKQLLQTLMMMSTLQQINNSSQVKLWLWMLTYVLEQRVQETTITESNVDDM